MLFRCIHRYSEIGRLCFDSNRHPAIVSRWTLKGTFPLCSNVFDSLEYIYWIKHWFYVVCLQIVLRYLYCKSIVLSVAKNKICFLFSRNIKRNFFHSNRLKRNEIIFIVKLKAIYCVHLSWCASAEYNFLFANQRNQRFCCVQSDFRIVSNKTNRPTVYRTQINDKNRQLNEFWRLKAKK